MNRLLAELFGTFALVFAGTGAIVVNTVTGGSIGHVGVALTFGLIVMAMISAFGNVSGAHLNPAVTIGFAAARRFPWKTVPSYLAAQIMGALLASFLLRGLFPESVSLGGTHPLGGAGQSFVLEIVITMLLMLTVLCVSAKGQDAAVSPAMAIGGYVALAAMFAGPICGASMNPARSLGPALVELQLAHLGIYLVGPVLGALLAVPLCLGVKGRECCCGETSQA